MPNPSSFASGWVSGGDDMSQYAGLGNGTNFTSLGNTSRPHVTLSPHYDLSPCLWIFVKFIGDTYVVPWDIFLLVPNAIFLLFLIVTFRKSVRELRARASPIVTTFYVLICLTCALSTVRCVIIMFVSGFSALHNQILWLFVRFFQLVTELSVLILGIIYGPSDSLSSTRRVLFITVLLSVAYTSAQGVLEKVYHKVYFNKDLYMHGGMLFTLISSACFCAVYFIISCLPLLPLQRIRCSLVLPEKPSFYIYTIFLCAINIVGCVGASLVDGYNDERGFCLVSTSLFVYFSLFTPIIYLVFLQPFILYRKETEAPVDNTEVEHLLKCNYNVSEPLGYSSSAIASGGKSISISAAVPAAQTQCSLDVGYDSSYGSINTGPLRPYTSDGK